MSSFGLLMLALMIAAVSCVSYYPNSGRLFSGGRFGFQGSRRFLGGGGGMLGAVGAGFGSVGGSWGHGGLYPRRYKRSLPVYPRNNYYRPSASYYPTYPVYPSKGGYYPRPVLY
ncbi:hypothetical protein ScPMuIL_007189 [Solemya velum]